MNDAISGEFAERSWTVRTYAGHWLATTGADTLRAATVVHYRHILGSYAVPILGDVPLADLVPWHVCHLLIRLHDAGYSSGTGRVVLAVLRSVLWQAKQDRIVVRNVAAQVEAPSRTWPRYLAVNGYESRQRPSLVRS